MIAEHIKTIDNLGRPRKYSYNSNFFKKIDTEEKAYWLGFLYADGCIAEHSVNLLLNQKDIETLYNFKKSLDFTGPVELREDLIDYGKKYGLKLSKTAKVRIHSNELREDLIKLGCLPRKTFVLKFPSKHILPNKLIRHFIRGYFDGDGSVYIRKYMRKDGKIRGHANITSTLHILKNIKKVFIKKFKLNSSSVYICVHPTSKGIFRLMFASFESMRYFRDYLYNDANYYLKRKKDIFYQLYLESSKCHNRN